MIIEGPPVSGTPTPAISLLSCSSSKHSYPYPWLPPLSCLLAGSEDCHFYSPPNVVPIEFKTVEWEKTSGAAPPTFSF